MVSGKKSLTISTPMKKFPWEKSLNLKFFLVQIFLSDLSSFLFVLLVEIEGTRLEQILLEQNQLLYNSWE